MTHTPRLIKFKLILTTALHWLRVWGRFVLGTAKVISTLFGLCMPVVILLGYQFWDRLIIVPHKITLWSFILNPICTSLTFFFIAFTVWVCYSLWSRAWNEIGKKIVLSFGRGVINCSIFWTARIAVMLVFALYNQSDTLLYTTFFDLVLDEKAELSVK